MGGQRRCAYSGCGYVGWDTDRRGNGRGLVSRRDITAAGRQPRPGTTSRGAAGGHLEANTPRGPYASPSAKELSHIMHLALQYTSEKRGVRDMDRLHQKWVRTTFVCHSC